MRTTSHSGFTPSDGLDRIEGGREIEPGHDRPGGLGRRGHPQRERRPPAREVAANRHAHPARHAAGPEDGVELGEPGRMDALRVEEGAPFRLVSRALEVVLEVLERHGRQRPDDLAREPIAREPRRRRSPA